jgi:hypothetical protein
MNLKTFAVLFTILIAVSCVSSRHRPDAPLCGSSGECHDSRGEHREDTRTLLCTSPLGYAAYEDYIDKLELRVRELERRCKKEEGIARETNEPVRAGKD